MNSRLKRVLIIIISFFVNQVYPIATAATNKLDFSDNQGLIKRRYIFFSKTIGPIMNWLMVHGISPFWVLPAIVILMQIIFTIVVSLKNRDNPLHPFLLVFKETWLLLLILVLIVLYSQYKVTTKGEIL